MRLVAADEGIDAETLGIKGKSGILKSMKTRAEFLKDVTQPHCVPLHPEAFLMAPIRLRFGLAS